jgi:hypothetical protein
MGLLSRTKSSASSSLQLPTLKPTHAPHPSSLPSPAQPNPQPLQAPAPAIEKAPASFEPSSPLLRDDQARSDEAEDANGAARLLRSGLEIDVERQKSIKQTVVKTVICVVLSRSWMFSLAQFASVTSGHDISVDPIGAARYTGPAIEP